SADGQVQHTRLYVTIATIVVFIVAALRRRAARVKYGFPVVPFFAEVLRLAFVSALMGGFAMIMVIYLGIPWAVIFVLALTVIFDFVARDTTFGRHLYAIGGNPDAARLSGINVPRHVFGPFMIMGLITAIAGIISTSRLNAAPTSAGQNAELDAIASAFIDGTFLL